MSNRRELTQTDPGSVSPGSSPGLSGSLKLLQTRGFSFEILIHGGLAAAVAITCQESSFQGVQDRFLAVGEIGAGVCGFEELV